MLFGFSCFFTTVVWLLFIVSLDFYGFSCYTEEKEVDEMPKSKELAYERCCFYCENAVVSEEEDSVFCKKKNKDVAPEGLCHSFFYDLLRRTPVLPSLPDVELPTLD